MKPEDRAWLDEQRAVARNILSLPSAADRTALWWEAESVHRLLSIIDALEAELAEAQAERAQLLSCKNVTINYPPMPESEALADALTAMRYMFEQHRQELLGLREKLVRARATWASGLHLEDNA